MSHREIKRRILSNARRIVVKLGSSVLTTDSGVDNEQIGRISAEICAMTTQGVQVAVVSSGARAAGLARLGLNRIPKKIVEQQAAAAIGQIRLMSLYERYFSDFDRHVGQVLLTADDLLNRTRYLNAERTFDHLLRHGIVPIVNENDSVATDELKFGDNDRLSALVAGLIGAHLLIILTDVDGLYDGDPRTGTANLVETVNDVETFLASGIAGGVGSAVGTGGMASKLLAARSASHRGIATIVASGRTPGVLARILDPQDHVGTLVVPTTSPMGSRKHWIGHGLPVAGSLTLDEGAVDAVSRKGSSLLAAGVTAITGKFSRGDCVRCLDKHGREFARGLVTYNSDECRLLLGKPSARIDEILGYHAGDEVIHRDDLALLTEFAETAAPKTEVP